MRIEVGFDDKRVNGLRRQKAVPAILGQNRFRPPLTY